MKKIKIMNRQFLWALLLIPIINFAQNSMAPKKILMVVSSYGKDHGGTRPGFEFDEFAKAYLVFKSNGLSVDVASPNGGKVESEKYDTKKVYNRIVLENKNILQKLENTISTSKIEPTLYDAIFIVGGKGAMFDLPYDAALQDVILDFYRRKNTIISSVCHGPASFAHVKDGDKYIIEDVEVTSFCNTEEKLFGGKWKNEYPFQLEDMLIERGARFTRTDFMLINVVVSGKFVTGQNPLSTSRSAVEVVKALGIEPVQRMKYKEEMTEELIQEVLSDKKTFDQAKNELEKNKSSYEMPMIGYYGHFKINSSKDNMQNLEKGIQLIELTIPYFYNERLQFTLAEAYIGLGNTQKAKNVLSELIGKGQLEGEAEKLLREIN